MYHRLVSGKQINSGLNAFFHGRAHLACVVADVLGLVPPLKESGHITAEDDSLSLGPTLPLPLPLPKSSIVRLAGIVDYGINFYMSGFSLSGFPVTWIN